MVLYKVTNKRILGPAGGILHPDLAAYQTFGVENLFAVINHINRNKIFKENGFQISQ